MRITYFWDNSIKKLCKDNYGGLYLKILKFFVMKTQTLHFCLLNWTEYTMFISVQFSRSDFLCFRFPFPFRFTTEHYNRAPCAMQYVLIQSSRSGASNSLRPCGLQHDWPPCPSPTLKFIQTHVMPSNHLFSSCPQSFPASGSFLMSQFFVSGGQCIGVSSSTSVLPMNIKYWFPLGRTGWISLQSKGLSRVFSNTTVQKH